MSNPHPGQNTGAKKGFSSEGAPISKGASELWRDIGERRAKRRDFAMRGSKSYAPSHGKATLNGRKGKPVSTNENNPQEKSGLGAHPYQRWERFQWKAERVQILAEKGSLPTEKGTCTASFRKESASFKKERPGENFIEKGLSDIVTEDLLSEII